MIRKLPMNLVPTYCFYDTPKQKVVSCNIFLNSNITIHEKYSLGAIDILCIQNSLELNILFSLGTILNSKNVINLLSLMKKQNRYCKNNQ